MRRVESAQAEVREHHFAHDRPSLRGVIHLRSVWVFAVAFGTLVTLAPDVACRAWVAVHGLSIVAMLGVSAAYHTWDVTPATRHRLRRLDHCAILLAIAGSYTGIAGLALDGTHRAVWLAIMWGAALTGIGLRLFVFDGLHPLIAASYLVVGWVAALDAPTMSRALNSFELGAVAVGGVLYTVGAIVLALRRPNPWPTHFGFHEIFHTLVVVAAACHLAATWSLVVRR